MRLFTGIVEELGRVRSVRPHGDGARLTVSGPVVTADAGEGGSIAVNGVCLTVVDVVGDTFTADVMRVTRERSNLAMIGPGDRVNLERPLTLQAMLGGHLVQGHVDATAPVLTRTPGDEWEVIRIGLPESLSPYVVEKGSVAVDGVSLTASALGDGWFEVSLIPTTLERTTLGTRAPGALVNLEVDVIAKYVERMLGAAR